MCFDAKVSWDKDAYIVMTVSTRRERDHSYEDLDKYNIVYSDRSFTSITKTLARATKLIKDTKSATGERVLEKVMQGTIDPFGRGLKQAQEKLDELQSRVFGSMRNSLREEALLEYSLAALYPSRAVRADIRHEVEDCTNKYLEAKKDLGDSIAACDGLQTLSIYKLKNIDKVFFHYRDTTAGEMQRIKHVDDVNKLPQEVLAKLSVLQATGIDAMDNVGYSYETKVLTSIGCVTKDAYDYDFVEDAMCVYISPETMAEVEALVGY
jgi:Mg2+ and Co2+ transporter CorA